jgi:hypothetical protein
MSAFMEGVVSIALAIVGLAMVSVLVSKNAQTPAVIQSAASGFNNALGVAEAPVSGASYTPNLSYGGNDTSFMFGG